MAFGRGELPEEIEALAKAVVDSIFVVHKELGPGLLESVYEQCLAFELRSRGFAVQQQLHLPVIYKGIEIDAGLRLDLLINDTVIVEIKSVERFHPVYEAQVLTYLRLSQKRLCFLVNFNVPLIKDGLKRYVR